MNKRIKKKLRKQMLAWGEDWLYICPEEVPVRFHKAARGWTEYKEIRK